MTNQEFLQRLGEVLECPLSGSERLSDLDNWDSLAKLSFLALANENFDVILGANDLARCRTVGDLLGLVAQQPT